MNKMNFIKKTEQGKLKLSVSKAEAINRLLQLHAKQVDSATLGLFCKKNGEFRIKYLVSKYNGKYAYVLSRLYAKITVENGETYVSYYTGINSLTVFLVCGGLGFATILFLLSNLFFRIDSRTIVAAIGCAVSLIIYLSTVLQEKSNPYANSEIFVQALKQYVDAINNWEI